MKLLSLLVAAVGAFTAVNAEMNSTISINGTAIMDTVKKMEAIQTIRYEAVKPFDQPEPVTDAQKAAVKFKPQLKISYGCHPYAAVNKNGMVSEGLKWGNFKTARNGCELPPMGSQVYARTTEYKNKFAIMYAWYFPKGRRDTMTIRNGHRHEWLWAVVWVDPLDTDPSDVLGVSMSGRYGYEKHAPVKGKYLDGASVKFDSYKGRLLADRQALRLTKHEGEEQELIQWDQLTKKARDALSLYDFDESLLNTKDMQMPLRDDVFQVKIAKSYPF